MLNVGIVGLGTIATTHLEVLASIPEARVVFGVDTGEPAAPLPPGVPLLRSLDDAVRSFPELELLVIATPTPTHTALVSRALELTPGLVLAEKPLSGTPSELRELEAAYGRDVLEARLRVAHHFAFSPEVLWAEELVAARPEWGAPARVVCSFNDAYASKPAERLDSLVSSWIDSAGNQLSLLSRFVRGFRVLERGEADRGFRSACRLAYEGGEALLVSNWLAADTSKQTSLYFADDLELRMDHTSMTAMVIKEGSLVRHLGNDGSVGRKFAHYDGLYRRLIAGEEGPQAGYSLACELAEILSHPMTGGIGHWP